MMLADRVKLSPSELGNGTAASLARQIFSHGRNAVVVDADTSARGLRRVWPVLMVMWFR